jgi:oligogalacturonide lyase
MRKLFFIHLIGAFLTVSLAASDVGQRFPSEAKTYEDPVTGIPVRVLTHSPSNDIRIYQTHPQWTACGEWIVFRTADRSRDGHPQAFAVHEADGTIVQLTDGPGFAYRSIRLSRKENVMYYLRNAEGGQDLIRVDLDPLFADSAVGRMREEGYETVLTRIPGGHEIFTLDVTEERIFYPNRTDDEDGNRINAIHEFDPATKTHSELFRVDFTIGHIQANPHRSGEFIFCHETGGDAPQRIWIWRDGMEGAEPLFVEQESDWVTHEAWADEDHVIFNLMGHTSRLRLRPTGIALINVRTDEVRLLGQPVPNPPLEDRRGFWHCNASPDGRWAVGDTFSGNIYLIDLRTNAQHLLSTGHVMRPDHAHPAFSADSRRVLIQSGHLSDGQNLDLMILELPE